MISHHASYQGQRLSYHGIYFAIEKISEIAEVEGLHPIRYWVKMLNSGFLRLDGKQMSIGKVCYLTELRILVVSELEVDECDRLRRALRAIA